jgi:quinoprotein glucose dehydrogenase
MTKKALRRIGRVASLAAVILWTIPAAGQHGTQGAEWRSYHGDNGGTQYSPLDQINKDNVKDLQIAWRWKGDNFGSTPEMKNETTPLYIDGVLYATAGNRRAVVAIDAGSGETLWMWKMDEGERWQRSPRKQHRGVAYWTDGSGDNRIVVVTSGFHLVALEAETGRPIPTFGTNGVVDLMKNLRPGVDPVGNIGSSSPAMISNGVVVVGPAQRVGYRPPTKENVPGWVRGYDVRTGKLLWTFHTIPEVGEEGYETWEDDSASYTGNVGIWPPMAADDELGYVYLPIEAPTGDYYGGHRHGDNLFSSTLVAVDVKTGKKIWHQQLVRHDIWDRDIPTAPILMDVTVDGTPRKIVVQLTKMAYAFVYDRVTGEPIWPIEDTPVPPSDVPGERAAATQPFPTRPAPFDRQGVTVDDLIDFTPALKQEALEIVKSYRLSELYTPPSLAAAPDGTKGTLSLPGVRGGANWEHAAIDAETGILYVGTNTELTNLALGSDPKVSNMRYIVTSIQAPTVQGLSLIKPPYGRITAIDMNTGEHLWVQANGDTPDEIRNHPALKGVDLPRTGSNSRAGIVVTKTLVLAGEGWGGQPFFRAYDKQTGEIVATFELPSVQTGIPMTYMHEGKQYIVMSVGSPAHPAELVALSLPE